MDDPLEEIYTIYSIAYLNTGKLDKAEKYLKIANQINPVSDSILMRLCELYQTKNEEEKLKDLTCDIFKYSYNVEILISIISSLQITCIIQTKTLNCIIIYSTSLCF